MKDICEALIKGEVDFIFTTRRTSKEYLPRSGVKGKIRRLFDNPWEEQLKIIINRDISYNTYGNYKN
jgi:CRISPR/Cas system CSM-associated protein Csm3 (group 7 of RAMP superfamily)